MIVPIEKPGTPQEVLEHFGVKGMKWGVRNEAITTGRGFVRSHLATKDHVPKGLSGIDKFDPDTQAALKSISSKMNRAYGFKMDEFIPIKPRSGLKKFFFGSSAILAYVEIRQKDNKIHVLDDKSLKKTLTDCQKSGWLVKTKSSDSIQALISHESAHAMFHTYDSKDYKTYEKYRKNAWKAAENQAIKDGTVKIHETKLFGKTIHKSDPYPQMVKHISGYANYSMWIEEPEAEMFSSYHYGTNPPKFVDAYWTEMHRQMGKRVQPFSGRKVSHAKST